MLGIGSAASRMGLIIAIRCTEVKGASIAVFSAQKLRQRVRPGDGWMLGALEPWGYLYKVLKFSF